MLNAPRPEGRSFTDCTDKKMQTQEHYPIALDKTEHLIVGGVAHLLLNVYEENVADLFVDHSPLLKNNIKI